MLFRHVLRNALIPIITSAGSYLPYVFLGSLVFESFFGMPGLGAYVIEAIGKQDFAIVRTMVFVGSLLYIADLRPDRHRLHLGRSAGAPELSAMPKFVLLWTDVAVWLLVAALVGYVVMVLRRPQLAANWGKVFRDAPALASSLVLLLCLGVTAARQRALPAAAAAGARHRQRRRRPTTRAPARCSTPRCARLVQSRESDLLAAAGVPGLHQGIGRRRRRGRARRAAAEVRRRPSARIRRRNGCPTWPARAGIGLLPARWRRCC